MTDRIASRENEKVKAARRIASSPAARREEGLFFAEGKKLCYDLAGTLPLRTAFFTEKFLKQNPGIETFARENYIISEPVDDKLSETKSPQGLYCLFETPQSAPADFAWDKGVLLCEGVQDPANIGAVLRSAAAFGFGGVGLLPGCADPFAPKALRASMGAVGRIPIGLELTAGQVRSAADAAGAAIYAASLRNALPLAEVHPEGPFALLVGSEGRGLSREAEAMADKTVYIPMHRGVESLNAAVAASVLMFHFSQA